jgi:hypothetical protein
MTLVSPKPGTTVQGSGFLIVLNRSIGHKYQGLERRSPVIYDSSSVFIVQILVIYNTGNIT